MAGFYSLTLSRFASSTKCWAKLRPINGHHFLYAGWLGKCLYIR